MKELQNQLDNQLNFNISSLTKEQRAIYRKVFADEMIKNGATKEQVAQFELLIEYTYNQEFKENLENYVFEKSKDLII